MQKGKLFIVSGPSQVGKDSVVRSVKRDLGLNLKHIVTNTTRIPRPGEKNGVTYNFLTDDEFKSLIKQGELLEWARVRQALFGTPKKPVLQALEKGYNVILQIDVQGAAQVKAQLPETVLIFITAESVQEIKRRIFASTRMTLTLKESRWQEAVRELKSQPNYDYIVINRLDKLKDTVKQVRNIIKQEISKIP